MKSDEFAFVNHQLAGMLRDGIPLEGALKELCRDMRQGELRAELEALREDLAQGSPLPAALERRKLPPFYKTMVEVGQKAGNLPKVLTMVADYYQKRAILTIKLRGLMVYPVIILLATSILSVFLTVFSMKITGLIGPIIFESSENGFHPMYNIPPSILDSFGMLAPALVVGLFLVLAILLITVPVLRRRVAWIIPGFKEARVANVASILGMLLEHGCDWRQSLQLVRSLDDDAKLKQEMDRWEKCLSEGSSKITDLARGSRVIPPLFYWFVGSQKENWGAGFRQAAGLYYDRALAKADLMLYCVLPAGILLAAGLIFVQLYEVGRWLMSMVTCLGEL